MSQAQQTREGDWIYPPTLTMPYKVTVAAVTAAAGSTDLHASRTQPQYADGHYITVMNSSDAETAYVVFDSTSGGTAASTSNALPIPPLGERSFMLPAGSLATGVVAYPCRYMKHIGSGNLNLYWYLSTYVGGQQVQ